MLKELSVKEALQLLLDNFPNPVKGLFWSTHVQGYSILTKHAEATPGMLIGILHGHPYPFDIECTSERINHFAIEVSDTYRYMTYSEVVDWSCLHTQGYQVKSKKDSYWASPAYFCYYDVRPETMEYRTIQEVDGKVLYGEPQEFKVKVS